MDRGNESGIGDRAAAGTASPQTVRLVRNREAAHRGVYASHAILSRAGAEAARAEITGWPGYAVTPLHDLRALAQRCGVGRVSYKDEGSRFDLSSFKALGGAYAVGRLLQRRLAPRLGRAPTMAELASGAYADATGEITVISATDGNHGRSVAAGARMFGCRCVIVLHAEVSPGRERAIADFGARIIRVPGDFDESVREALKLTLSNGWELVADTYCEGFGESCMDVMQGYTVMVDEVLDQLRERSAAPPTHVFVQAGVGGLGAAVLGHLWETLGERAPIMVMVEPQSADCLFQSALAGRPVRASGDLRTVMAGLSCGEVSAFAWAILRRGAEFFMTISDAAALNAMRLLADTPDGISIVAGESGGAGLAGLLAVCADDRLRAQLRLTPQSHVLLFGTEGATDPALYRVLMGAARP